jgi:ubiquinone/menaquinone biosynthesis C-methylase UbiE
MCTTLERESVAGHENGPSAGSASWRAWLAPWAVNGALLLMVVVIGGSLYEHLVVDPVWPGNGTIIQPEHGGINRKVFWGPIHGALTLAFPVALWAGWRNLATRCWLLVALAAYLALRVWTLIYFIPLALRFETEGVSDASLAQRWVLLSVLRLPLVLAAAAALWMAARRLEARGPGALNRKKGYKGLAMEGFIARWYAGTTGKRIEEFRQFAEVVASQVGSAGAVLEVAPGPGYLAIELARRGPYRVVGLDISKSFVRMATENAKNAGVAVTFRQGDVASMPFDAGSFDFIVCRAAFKNFMEPIPALNEMYRVLRPGGKALIIDLRSDASHEAIDALVKGMGLGWINSLLTKLAFKYMLLKTAYSQEQFRDMASQSDFKTCAIRADPVGLEVALTK